ncbi:exodeoxyribonuclease III [Paenibacillus glycanilyticus]|uniref:exodeoxyribonuclease III n=1 Tax=Paenibacillus glycanilyticus TaxID=126569 RepID=UPI0019111BF7|nr:exodeoxyribonuclease III [Paenibacillus glycanilyticus]
MKFVSWNVNGLRACVNKGFLDYFNEMDADFFCLQETKLQEGQINLELGEAYHLFWHYAEKKGYSGTAIFTKHKPLSVSYGLGEEDEDNEGRVITLEYENFYLVTVYTPNARRDLSRLDFRLAWEELFRGYLTKLDEHKPVIVCGDLNVAHQEIDLKNAKSNRGNSGFTDEEREKMTRLLDAGFIDSFRYLYPDRTDAYTWWSFMPKIRERNVGWRIDYFLTSARLAPSITDAGIDSQILGSDHCPVVLTLDMEKGHQA